MLVCVLVWLLHPGVCWLLCLAWACVLFALHGYFYTTNMHPAQPVSVPMPRSRETRFIRVVRVARRLAWMTGKDTPARSCLQPSSTMLTAFETTWSLVQK